jgi:2-C-methyl-D-erythritol 4-phosphate cytidylyltransferase
VAVHDAARPLTDAAAIDRVFAAAARFDAVVPAVPVSSTLKRTEASKADVTEEADPLDAILGSAGKETVDAWPIVETVRRDALWLAQTPQTFRRALLEEAYARLGSGQIASDAVTDDAMLIEAMGRPVHVVEGDPLNVKITAPADLQLAEAILSMGRGQPARDALGPKRKFPTWAEADDE